MRLVSRRRIQHGHNRAILGEHNVISDISGFKHKASEMRKMEGVDRDLLVHWTEWNPEHPQLHIEGRTDDISVPNVRVRPQDKFADTVDGDYLFQDGDEYFFNDSLQNPFGFN